MNPRHVFAAIMVPNKGFAIAIVEADVAGYALAPDEPLLASYGAAQERATAKNAQLGIDPLTAWNVVASSMSASSKSAKRWGPKGT